MTAPPLRFQNQAGCHPLLTTSNLLWFNICCVRLIAPSLITAGWVGAIPVLSCEGLSLGVEAAVHHSDQVMLTESSLCQCYGAQTRRLHRQKKNKSWLNSCSQRWLLQVSKGDDVPFRLLIEKVEIGLCSHGELLWLELVCLLQWNEITAGRRPDSHLWLDRTWQHLTSFCQAHASVSKEIFSW